MIKLILDLKTWRSGKNRVDELYHTGVGQTSLLNDEGFGCCLGQFIHQCNPEIPVHNLVNKLMPHEIPLRYTVDYFRILHDDTDLSFEAAMINDSETITTENKIIQLKFLFALFGFDIHTK